MILPSPACFIDIHSHKRESEEGVFRVFNVFSSVFPDVPKDMAMSIGLHPWHLSPEAIENMPDVIRKALQLKNVLAIGETGLDKVIKTSLEIQTEVFKKQIELSIEFNKPLIIHCVRAFSELFELRRIYKQSPAWILHGFNADKSVALECIRHGIYISVGIRLLRNKERTSEILKHVPASMIFAETDDHSADIREIYQIIAEKCGISVELLKQTVYSNYHKVFI